MNENQPTDPQILADILAPIEELSHDDIWKEFLHEGVCSLCFGTGVIPARTHQSIRGDFKVGKQACICPDGRAMKYNLLAHISDQRLRVMGFEPR